MRNIQTDSHEMKTLSALAVPLLASALLAAATSPVLARDLPTTALHDHFGGVEWTATEDPSPPEWASAYDVAFDDQARVVTVASWESAENGAASAVFRYGSGGQADPGFGGDGRVDIADFEARAVLVRDGAIYVGGERDGAMAVVRLYDNGAFDPWFGTWGVATAPPVGECSSSAYDVAVDSKGRVVVAGTVWDHDFADWYHMATARLTTTGKLDPSYSVDGRTVTGFGWAPSMGADVAVDGWNRVVVVGTSGHGFPQHSSIAVARMLADGEPDGTFDNDGRLVIDVAGSMREGGTGIALRGWWQPSGWFGIYRTEIALAGRVDDLDTP